MRDMQQLVARTPLEVGDVVMADIPGYLAPTQHTVTDILLVHSALLNKCWFVYELDGHLSATIDRLRFRITESGPVALRDEETACRRVAP